MNYKQSTYDIYSQLPLKLVKKAIDEEWAYSLCYFIWLRKVHRKPIFYNYTLRKVSELIKCSPATLRHHLNILRDKGLIAIQDKHLFLKGSSALRKEHKSMLVPVLVCNNRTDQLTALRFVLPKRKLHIEDKAISLKKDIISLNNGVFLEPKEFVIAMKWRKKYMWRGVNVETSMKDKLTLSNSQLGYLCNRSQRTAIKIQKAFNTLGLVQTQKNWELVDTGFNRKAFFSKYFQGKYKLTKAGNVFRVLPNQWVLPEPPSMVQYVV